MCGARGHRNGETRTSLSTTTMFRLTGPLKFRSFWPRTTWQWSPNPHTHPIWPPVTFSSSQSWSFGWRVEHSTPLKRFKRNRSGYLTQFQKGTSRDASKPGRNAGTAVFVQKGSTLKVMEEFNIQGKQTSFYKYCPGTFGYTFVLYMFLRVMAPGGLTQPRRPQDSHPLFKLIRQHIFNIYTTSISYAVMLIIII